MKHILILLLIGLVSCKSAQNNSDQPVDLDQIANEVLKEKCERSDMGDKALFFTSNKTPGVFTRTILVLSITDGKTIHGPQKLNGTVEWHDDNILKIEEYTGVVEDPSAKDKGPYYFNILTKNKSRESR